MSANSCKLNDNDTILQDRPYPGMLFEMWQISCINELREKDGLIPEGQENSSLFLYRGQAEKAIGI